METRDRWRREVQTALGAQALEQPGAERLLAAVNRYVEKNGLSPDQLDHREWIRDLLWFYRDATTGVRAPREPERGASRRGFRQRHEAALDSVVRELRTCHEDLIAFRAAWGLPKNIAALDEPARSAEFVRVLASLPKAAMEALASVVANIVRTTGWSIPWGYRFAVVDEPPDPYLNPTPALATYSAAPAEALDRMWFALERRDGGQEWPDISAEWDREQRRAKRPNECYGESWRQFQRDVARTVTAVRGAIRREASIEYEHTRALAVAGVMDLRWLSPDDLYFPLRRGELEPTAVEAGRPEPVDEHKDRPDS